MKSRELNSSGKKIAYGGLHRISHTKYFILIWNNNGLFAVKTIYFKSSITIQKCDKNITNREIELIFHIIPRRLRLQRNRFHIK